MTDFYDSAKQDPKIVKAVLRLKHDIRAMEELTQGDFPLVGNASKAAFGASIQIKDKILYQYGQWSS